MWVVSFPSFLLSLVTASAVRNWASLTTNRRLLSNLLRIYVFAFFLIFIFTLWLACAWFLTFKKIKNWTADVTLAQIFPYYVSMIIFIMPYLAAVSYYTLEISYYIDLVDMGGNITEPNPPEHVMDLSDVSLFQSCVFVCAMPCILCIQCSDLMIALRAAYDRHYKDQPLFSFGANTARKDMYIAPEDVKKKRRVLRRIWKTLTRWFRGSK